MSQESRNVLTKIMSRQPAMREDGPRRVSTIFNEFLQLEQEDGRDSGTELGFAARCLIPATLPYRRVEESTYTRRAGNYVLSLVAPPETGLPYGRYPRLLIAWLVTEAVRTRSPQIPLGRSMLQFMEQLGVPCSGGKTGSAPRFRDQMKRLFGTTFSFTADSEGSHSGVGMRVAKKHLLWWDAIQPSEPSLFEGSFVQLSTDFFDEIVTRPVPIDLRVLRVLHSPVALDLYTWVTWRMFNLKGPTTVSWAALHGQFGSQASRARDFKREVERALKQVLEVYPAARVEVTRNGLVLSKSPTHVSRRLTA